MRRRANGVLLHISSLPTRFGIGDFGPSAYRFAEFLRDSRQSYWQILPLNPTDPKYDNAPYHSTSAFALNPLLISPELLVRDGLLQEDELDPAPPSEGIKVDYDPVYPYKRRLFERAFSRFDPESDPGYRQFTVDNAGWLDNYCLYIALREHFDGKI